MGPPTVPTSNGKGYSGTFRIAEKFTCLKSLRVESSDLQNIIRLLDGSMVDNLGVESSVFGKPSIENMVSFDSVASSFQEVNAMEFGPWIWLEMEHYFRYLGPSAGVCELKKLKRLTIHLMSKCILKSPIMPYNIHERDV
ncbi:hypothetical protein QJS10_CPB18g00888 [Acorus calamus]|uniref:Uncharacterized protein n=1 Tax=Acorus calamus TaxID=4465 RepID=A0AAV9CNS6_ACOCL|nr:hypothetical protein QJS10_CPB18g00888 [Acorus calamus]